MSYLRNIITNAVTADLDPQGVVYRTLIGQKLASDTTVSPDQTVQGNEAASGTFTVRAGEPIWEDMPVERAEQHPNRVLAGVLDAAAVGVDTQAILSRGLDRDITITAAEYTPNGAIKGAATNFRTVSIVSGDEEASPVTNAKLAYESGVNAAAGAESALALESGVKVKAGVNVVAVSKHSGTGIADPGGIVLVTYTHD